MSYPNPQNDDKQLLQGPEGDTRGRFLHPECQFAERVCRPHCPQIKSECVVCQGEISEDKIRKLRDRLMSVQDASADRRLQIQEVRRAFGLKGTFSYLSWWMSLQTDVSC